jgi:hypothetical protein
MKSRDDAFLPLSYSPPVYINAPNALVNSKWFYMIILGHIIARWMKGNTVKYTRGKDNSLRQYFESQSIRHLSVTSI